MQPKCIRCLLAIVGIALVLGVLSSSVAKTELSQYLKEYKDIVSQQSLAKTFKFSDGYPEVTNYIGKDPNGLPLFSVQGQRAKCFLFTGNYFIDLFNKYEKVKQDTIQAVFTEVHGTYFVGRQAVYKWNGYSIIRYKFPIRDRIQFQYSANNSILCYGRLGYAVLDKQRWVYTQYKGYQIDDSGTLCDDLWEEKLSLVRIVGDQANSNSVVIEIHTKQGQVKFSIPNITDGANVRSWYSVASVGGSGLIITKNQGKQIVFIPADFSTSHTIAFNDKELLLGIIKDDKQPVIVTEYGDGKTTIVKTYVFDFSQMKLIPRKQIPLTSISNSDYNILTVAREGVFSFFL